MASDIHLFEFFFWKRGNGRRAHRARDTTSDFRNARSSQDLLPLHWVAGNVHSQGSKSFPKCIDAWPAGGVPFEGTKELTFRDRSSSAAV